MNNIFDSKTGTLDLSKIDKNKTWIIFYKKGCNSCSVVLKYFWDNNIKYRAHDLDTKEGLTVAVYNGVLVDCEKMVPVIIEISNDNRNEID